MSLRDVIFGAKPPYGTPPFAPDHPRTGGADPVPRPGQQQRGISGFLERAFNPQNALGQFGMALTAAGGGPIGDAMGYMMQQRLAAGQSGQEFDQWRQRYDYETEHPRPSNAQPHRWENNEGDLMELGPEGNPITRYDDPTPKMNLVPDGRGGYNWVSLPGAPPQLPVAPVGPLTPIGPTTQNTPAPQLGANGMPTVLTRAQYQATVNELGQAATDAWVARNNVTVRAD